MRDIIKKLDSHIEETINIKNEFGAMLNEVSEVIDKFSTKEKDYKLKKVILIYIYILKNQLEILLYFDATLWKGLNGELTSLVIKKLWFKENKLTIDDLEQYFFENFKQIMNQVNINLSSIGDHIKEKGVHKELLENSISTLNVLEEKIKKGGLKWHMF